MSQQQGDEHDEDIGKISSTHALTPSSRVGRRRFVKGVAAGIGAATIGTALRGQTATEALNREGVHLGNTLRAVTWTGKNTALGAFTVEGGEVRLSTMSVQGERLHGNEQDIASFPAGEGPIAIGVAPLADQRILVTKSTSRTVARHSASFDLDANMRKYFLEQGIALDGYRTVGDHIFEIQQIAPEPFLFNWHGEIVSNAELRSLWRDQLTGAHYEPISINYLDNRWILFLITSGKYGLDATIPDEIVGVELSDVDASIVEIDKISKIDGHFSIGYKSIEIDDSNIAFVSTDDFAKIKVVLYNVAKKTTKTSNHNFSSFTLSNRFLQHDRLIVSGRKKTWVAEVTPGVYSLETMGAEIL